MAKNLENRNQERAQQRMRELPAILESTDDAIVGMTLRIIESAMDAIVSVDEEQRIVLFNAAAERMFGCSAEEVLGSPLDRFIPVQFRTAHRGHIRAFGATGKTSRAMGRLGEWTAVRADGREFAIEASICQIEINGAKRFTAILRDMTERKRAEAELARSEGQLRALAARLQNAREEESIRIARELHDQLGRCLTTLKMDIASIEQTVLKRAGAEIVRPVRDKTKVMLEAIDEMVQVVREISTELRPGILDDLGLPAAIEWRLKEFQKRSGICCVLQSLEESLDLSQNQTTALFRIFQEMLTNAARHSRAERVWVNLYIQDRTIVLEVEDDGVGISPAALAKSEGLGLLGMRERAALVGGAIEISSKPGKGTVIIARMPIVAPQNEDSDR